MAKRRDKGQVVPTYRRVRDLPVEAEERGYDWLDSEVSKLRRELAKLHREVLQLMETKLTEKQKRRRKMERWELTGLKSAIAAQKKRLEQWGYR